MALTLTPPTVSVNRNTPSITVTDSTGVYNVSTNPGGWGTPNTALADLNNSTTICNIVVTHYTSTNLTGTEYTFNIYTREGTISNVADLSTVFTPADFGMTSVFDDGIYSFKFTVDKDLVGGTGDENESGLTSTLFVVNLQTDIQRQFINMPKLYDYTKAQHYNNDYKELLDLIFIYSLYTHLSYIKDDAAYISLHFQDVFDMYTLVETFLTRLNQ